MRYLVTNRLIIGLFLLLAFNCRTIAQEADTTRLDPKRVIPLSVLGGGLYVGSLAILSEQWYDERVPFHTFNDNAQWLQMDKVGHGLTAYYLTELCDRSLIWAGSDRKKSLLISASISLSYLSVIEVFDGFAEKWGFSTGDMIANFAGVGIYSAQAIAWDEQRIRLKYNFLPSSFAAYRPDALGVGFWQQALKDYNGQAYWLTSNPRSWGADAWPAWLSLAFGYSADGMTGGRENLFPLLDATDPLPDFQRRRQYYLSLDIDLDGLPAKRKWFRAFRRIVSFVKVPLPAIGIASDGEFLYGIR